jgi:plasmid stabilization system protein ParE
VLARDPARGKPRDDIRPGVLAFHLTRPARHVLFYLVDATGCVQVIRFLHDAMDFVRHVP